MKRVRTVVLQDESSNATGIEIPFDPKVEFGRTRVPVIATVRGYSYRTTIFSMKGCTFIPFANEHREATGLTGGERVLLTLEVDDQPRTVDVPKELADAMRSDRALRASWEESSFTRRKEWARDIEGAKKPETRARRVQKVIAALKEQA